MQQALYIQSMQLQLATNRTYKNLRSIELRTVPRRLLSTWGRMHVDTQKQLASRRQADNSLLVACISSCILILLITTPMGNWRYSMLQYSTSVLQHAICLGMYLLLRFKLSAETELRAARCHCIFMPPKRILSQLPTF